MAGTGMAASVPAPELPSLVLQVVGSFLPPRSIAKCRLVCRQWRFDFAACVDVIYLRVYLDPELTDLQIASAAAVFPSASCAVLLLPNWAHLPCNVYDSSGAAVSRPPLGRLSIAANAARRASLECLSYEQAPLPWPAVTFAAAQTGAVVEPTSELSARQVRTDLTDSPYTRGVSASAEVASHLPRKDAGKAACAAALRSLGRHLPLLRTVQVGDAHRPAPRPGPEAALEQCLDPEAEAASGLCFPGPQSAAVNGSRSACLVAPSAAPTEEAATALVGGANNKAAPCLAEDSEIVVDNACVVTVWRAACSYAGRWGYPATLLPPEGAVVWDSHIQKAAQSAAEQAVEEAHGAALDPRSLVLSAPMLSLAGLDLRCPVDLAGLVANGNCSGGAGIEGNLTTTLTALTVLQLRNAGQLATLRQLPRLEVVDLWCCDGSWHNGMTYWMSAAPQRIRRGLPLLATALTALTALVLRELEAQVEPPPPVAALATLPLLRSFKLELVYDDPWRELAELAEQLEEDEDHFEDGSEAGEEDRQVADPLKTAETMEGKEEGRKTVAGDTAAAAPAPGEILDSCIQRDSRMLDRRGPLIEGVVGLSWRHLRDSRPLDLFSCFGDKYDGDRSDASDRGTEMSAATNTGGVLTRASLTELDVTFLGAGLLPGAWHGISQLGSGLTRLALRVGRSPLEERLISNLQARTPGRWPPGSFSVHSLESLPHLRHLLLDVPLESHLAAGLAARALNLSAGMLPSLQRSQEWPSLTIPSGLESLALVGMWTRAGCPGAAAAPSAAWVAAEAAGTCGRTEAVQLPLASIPLLPVRTMLRTVHLDGDLRHLVSDITGKVLCGLDLVDLRLAHRPAGRPFQRSCNGGNDDPVRNRKLLHGRLQLLWTQLPSNLQLLDVEGFHVHIDDTSHGDSALECKTDLPTFGGHPAYVGGMPSSRYLERLERLRLRHCAATLDGVYYCPLGEVAVQGCWLIPTKAVTMPTGTAPATEAVTPSPPWDATGQLQLLCQQPWASRLLRLDLQFIRLPCNLEVRVATAGPVGQGSWPCGSRPCNSTDGAVTVEYALPGAACTTRLCGLEHLSITWELEALSPGRRAERNAAIPTDQGPLAPCVGLPPDLASHLVASLPDGLRSLELYLGDGQQERPISVENCCGPWLLRLHSLRRLRLVLAVSSTRGATHGSATKTMSSCDTKGKTSRGAVETGRHCRNSSGSASSDGNCEGWLDNRGQSNRMVAETSGDVRSAKLPEVSDPRDEHPGRGDNGDEDCDYVGGDDWCSGQHAAGASTTAQSVKPLVASGWVHSQLADLVMGYLPHCQCEIVRVRLD